MNLVDFANMMGEFTLSKKTYKLTLRVDGIETKAQILKANDNKYCVSFVKKSGDIFKFNE